MSLLNKMFGWLVIKRKSVEPEHPDLTELDIDKLREALKVDEEARRMGAAGSPSPDKVGLSAPEMAISQCLETYRLRFLNWATSKLQRIHRKLISYDITELVNRSTLMAEEFEREASRTLMDEEVELRRRRELAEKKQSELERFREKNRLTRVAKESTGLRKTIYVLSAILIVIVEGVLNAGFFAEGIEGGLVMGFLYAFALALLNVVVALSLGLLGLPNLNHIKPFRRVLGGIAAGFAVCSILGIGLLIAHFRDSLSTAGNVESTELAALAMNTLFSDPFGLHDVFSLLLWFFSIVFGAMSLYEGYTWQDPYPGYERTQRAAEKARKSYDDGIALVRSELEQMKDDFLTLLADNLAQARENVQGYKTQVEDKRVSERKLQHGHHKAEYILEALVMRFRDENEIARQLTGIPVPAYFRENVPFKEIKWPDFSTDADELELQRQEELLAGLLAKLEDIRGKIQSSYDSKYHHHTPIREQI